MGKRAKSSRKGKKAWRANISTEDIHDFFEKTTKDAHTGGSLSNLPADSLFFVDTSKDLPVKRKIEKSREKVLRIDSLLRKNPFVEAVPSSKSKKKSNNVLKKFSDVATDAPKDDQGSGLVDIWENEDECNTNRKKTSKPSVIPAVEVEAPGCSFNPSFEDHQDSLAQAVAEEMQKVYKDELGPQPVPLVVQGQEIDEEDMYFLEADNGTDGDADDENLSGNDDDMALEKRSSKTKRVTQVDLNRRSRLKEQQRKEEAAKKEEALLKEIDSVTDIVQEIENEEKEKEKKRIRRIVARQERLKTHPPRLGKHKFEPAPSQVLLSEEITGSLRKLKGCYTLARDRFKSLEKRGLIPPVTKRRRK